MGNLASLLVSPFRLLKLLRWLVGLAFNAWTTPATWAASQLVTATDLNVQMRDNLGYLFARPQAVVKRDNNANYTTTSGTFVDIDSTNLKITLTISGSTVLLAFVGTFVHSGNNIFLDIDVDGARVGSAGGSGLAGASFSTPGNQTTIPLIILVTGLAPGAHTFKVQWAVSAGTGTLFSGSGTGGQDYIPVFSAVEVG